MSGLALADLRARGVVLEGGARLHVSCPANAVDELRPVLEAHRDELLDALQDEAEDDVVSWPLAYRRWLMQTVAFCLRHGYEARAAFWASLHSVGTEYAARQVEVAALLPEEQMVVAAIDSGFAPAEPPL